MDEVLVRRAEVEDVPAMAEVGVRGWRFAYAGIVSQEALDRLSVKERLEHWPARVRAQGPARAWVADRDGRVVGFAFTGPYRGEGVGEGAGEVYGLYVEPDVIGTGVGRTLFEHVVEDLRGRGFDPIAVWVHRDNDRARRFYERAGFRADGAEQIEDYEGAPVSEVRYVRRASSTG